MRDNVSCSICKEPFGLSRFASFILIVACRPIGRYKQGTILFFAENRVCGTAKSSLGN